MTKIVRTSTVPTSLHTFCLEQMQAMADRGYDVLAVSSPGPEMAEMAKCRGVRTFEVPMERQISLLRDIRSLWSMYRLLRRERPDIVHSITPKAGLVTMMAARMAGVPVRIHTFTGLVWPSATGVKQKILKATDRLLCRCATHIVPESRGVMEQMTQGRITRKPLRLLGHGNLRGIDGAHYSRTPEVMAQAGHLRTPQLTFLFVGRLVRDKGIDELVRAFHGIDSPDIRLVMVGRQEPELDPLSADVLRIMADDERITAPGELSDVRPWMAAADVLVLPSHREGFPNVVLEGGAMDLPVITTAVNGATDVIENGCNGVIIPLRDTEEERTRAFREALEDAIAAPEKYCAMGARARDRVLSRWSQEKVLAALLNLYDDTIRNIQKQ